MKKGFTLVEGLVIVVILGILVKLAMSQYGKAVERSRISEARITLAMLAIAQADYYKENGDYGEVAALGYGYLNGCNQTERYFSYQCGSANDGECYGTRCIGGTGKYPSYKFAYKVYLTPDGKYRADNRTP